MQFLGTCGCNTGNPLNCLNASSCDLIASRREFHLLLYNPLTVNRTEEFELPLDLSVKFSPKRRKSVAVYLYKPHPEEVAERMKAVKIRPLEWRLKTLPRHYLNSFGMSEAESRRIRRDRLTNSASHVVSILVTASGLGFTKMRVVVGEEEEKDFGANVEEGNEPPFDVQFGYYESSAAERNRSGAYLFRPSGGSSATFCDQPTDHTIVTLTFYRRDYVPLSRLPPSLDLVQRETVKRWGGGGDIIDFGERIVGYEIDYIVGPIAFEDGVGKEVFVRYGINKEGSYGGGLLLSE